MRACEVSSDDKRIGDSCFFLDESKELAILREFADIYLDGFKFLLSHHDDVWLPDIDLDNDLSWIILFKDFLIFLGLDEEIDVFSEAKQFK